MRRFISNRWFSLIDLLLVTIAATIEYLFPETAGWPLVIALFPWVVRGIAGKFPFKRTLFDLPVGIFLLTAAVGVWAAYDRQVALQKFWLLFAGVLLYYALASQPRENLHIIVGMLNILAGGIAIFFLLTYNWRNAPADFNVLNRLGDWWMGIRPQTDIRPPLPNFTGGILAMLMPYLFFLEVKTWRERRRLAFGFSFLMGCLAMIALVMTSSRAAWGALVIALGGWFLWETVGRLSKKLDSSRNRKLTVSQAGLFVFVLFILGGAGIIIVLTSPGGLDTLFNTLPGLQDGGSRLTLYQNSLPLVHDFLFTGGGLNAFAGIYSRYILVIPEFFYGYSHNLFLDIAIEQGIFGILAFSTIFLGTIYLLITSKNFQSDHWAVLISLVVIALHGMLDDALYGERGTPLLFLSLGIALAIQTPRLKESTVIYPRDLGNWFWRGFAGSGIVLCLTFLVFGKSILASWYADLGAVQMARMELDGFPTEQPVIQSGDDRLVEIEGLFERAIQLSQRNSTARYRLGLIALSHRDFPCAIQNLEIASYGNQGNRGVRKNLGYSYIWMNDFSKVVDLLGAVPEASSELGTYSWWWGTQGRDDLANCASQAAILLK